MARAHPAPDGLRRGEARPAALETIEPRRLKRGDLVAMGEAEDGTEGIVVHAEGFLGGGHGANEFRFMSTEVSRERPVNYEELAARVGEEKRRGGYLVWVVGPALVHSRARADFEWFIRNGYVQAVLAGNAVAVHDIEAAIFGTTLGMSNTGQPTEGGHGLHMRAINRVRAAGSIERAVETGLIKSGIMHALVTQRDPVRAGRLDPRRRPAARRLQRHARGAGRHAGAHRQGDRRHLRRHRAPRHRGGQHAAGVLPVRRRRRRR